MVVGGCFFIASDDVLGKSDLYLVHLFFFSFYLFFYILT